jgi:hypothetical protein
MMGCPLLSWQTCTPHGKGGPVLVTGTIATQRQVVVRSLPDALPAPCPLGWGVRAMGTPFVRESAVAPYAVVAPRAPVFKNPSLP